MPELRLHLDADASIKAVRIETSNNVIEMLVKKSITLSSVEEIAQMLTKIMASADRSLCSVSDLVASPSGLDMLGAMKFQLIGFDPLEPQGPLHLVEQINQTFTYIASLAAVRRLMKYHPEAKSFTLHLGTAAGFDVESECCEGIAAEVFAAITPQNNRKLARDVAKVQKSAARHKYVFFICPEISRRTDGRNLGSGGVIVEWLGPYEKLLQDLVPSKPQSST